MRKTSAIGIMLASVLLHGAVSVAQPVVDPSFNRLATQPATSEPLFKVGDDGKPVELNGPADLAALAQNELVTKEDLERIQPVIQQWQDKLDRLVVENIDLAVTLDTSALKKFDMKDTDTLMYVNDAVKMLSGADTLTAYLGQKGALTDEQVSENRRMVNDFQRQQMMFIGEAAQKEINGDVNDQIARVTEANYREALRDSFWVYNRIVDALAANPNAVAATLGGDASKVTDELAKLRQSTGEEAVDQVRAILSKLDYEQQKALAAKGLELDRASHAG